MADEKITEAIRVLTEAGYTVVPPRCKDCGGSGWVRYVPGPLLFPGCTGVAVAPCPRNCQTPMAYNSASTTPTPITDARSRSTRTHDL